MIKTFEASYMSNINSIRQSYFSIKKTTLLKKISEIQKVHLYIFDLILIISVRSNKIFRLDEWLLTGHLKDSGKEQTKTSLGIVEFEKKQFPHDFGEK
jgi:hypothetical protein